MPIGSAQPAGGHTGLSGYEIRIKGRITPSSRAAFDGFTITVNPVETVVCGFVADQAALYAVLERIQALGFELVEVRRSLSTPDQ